MKKRKLVIGISTLSAALKQTLKNAKRAEKGLPIDNTERLSFVDQATLFAILSPKRMELTRYLRQNGPMSARQLAKNLARDYKNIHQDIKLLLRLGLVSTNKDKEYIVPWDEITIELALAA